MTKTDLSKGATSAAAAAKGQEEEDGSHPHSQPTLQRPLDVERQAESQKQSAVSVPRFVRRNLPYFQSENNVNVHHNQGLNIFKLVRHDWFHALLRLPGWISITLLLGFWTIMLFVFAAFYIWYDNKEPNETCGLGPPGKPIQFGPAFAFSLETCTTVGYGLPSSTSAFFESQCWILQVIIFIQMSWSMMFNAFLFAFFFNRLAKCDSRGVQVVLSKQAIVTLVQGQVRFQVRVYDIDSKHPVVESHTRMYAVTKNRPIPRQLRIIQPNDELNSMLFLSLPNVVSHHIDMYSILHPHHATAVDPAGLTLRQVDSMSGSREEYICPVCGESYGTFERWRKHVLFNRALEENEGFPTVGTHLSLSKSDFTMNKYAPFSDLKALEDYFKNEISEIICVVEGIEPNVSGTFTALQSYQLEDIVFHPGARFSPCVEPITTKNKNCIRVDLDRFHDIVLDEALAKSNISMLARQERKPQRSNRPQDSFFTIQKASATDAAPASP